MDIDEYLKGILGQILDSYKTLVELNDTPDDLEIIKKETSKIKGLLQVIHNKLNAKNTKLITLSHYANYQHTTMIHMTIHVRLNI